MINDVQNRLMRIRNELKSQKTYSPLAYSSLLLPENTPELSYSGSFSTSSGNTPLARVCFRFTRTDGILEPPMINFAFSVDFSPTYKSFLESLNVPVSGDDLGYFDWIQASGYIDSMDENYVDFYIDFSSDIAAYYYTVNSISFNVTCQAIVNAIGVLSVERII